MRALVVFNPACSPARLEDLEALCRTAPFDAQVRVVPAADLKAVVERAAADASIDAVVLAGGDGTVSSGAAALAGTAKPLGVLPLGTLNHFARDLGIPLELDKALLLVAAGEPRAVDVAEVNGRVLVNNCSIGLYPEAVLRRELLRRAFRWGKWRAMLRGGWEALARFPVLGLTLRLPQRTLSLRTPQLVVGNNPYQTRLFQLGRRAELDRGELWVYVAHSLGRFGFLRLALRALLGRLEQEHDFQALCTTGTLRIETRRAGHRIRAALDGELVELESPLAFRTRPGELLVIAPPAAA
jgi:diacylglycerol kinase family enzyme